MAAIIKSEDIDTDFLPLIYDVIRSIEKDAHDSTQKIRDSHETYQRVMELKVKFAQCKEQIQRLNAVDCNKDEQLRRLDALRKQLIVKRDLLLKYRNMCHFDAPKAETQDSDFPCDLAILLKIKSHIAPYRANNRCLLYRPLLIPASKLETNFLQHL